MRTLASKLVETLVQLNVDELDVDEVIGRQEYVLVLEGQLPPWVVARARSLAAAVIVEEATGPSPDLEAVLDEDVPF